MGGEGRRGCSLLRAGHCTVALRAAVADPHILQCILNYLVIPITSNFTGKILAMPSAAFHYPVIRRL